MNSVWTTLSDASSYVSKTVQEVNIQDEATVVFSRARQYTEEKLGKADRTEFDPYFQQLEVKTDVTKSYTEKIKNNTAAVLVPNPAVRAELLFYDNVPMDKLGLKTERLTNLEYLGEDMVEAGTEFGPDTHYGSALLRVGQTQQRLGTLEKEYIQATHRGIIIPLQRFLDGEMKDIMRERKVLENKRLDLDAAKNKVKKERRELMKPKQMEVVDARAALHQADEELVLCQAAFDKQVSVTQEQMESLSHIQIDHTEHLACLVKSQTQYYSEAHQVMQELHKELCGVTEDDLQGRSILEKQQEKDLEDPNTERSSSQISFPKNIEVL